MAIGKIGSTKKKMIDENDIMRRNTVNPTTGIKPTATPSTSDSKVRDVINSYGSKYGISDSMIGWDQKNQNVLLNNESLIKADRVGSDNRAYAQEDMVKAAIDKYAQSKGLAQSPQQMVGSMTAGNSYQSNYSSKIDTILDQLMNKESFAYDPETDPVYQSLKKQYSAAGDAALTNTMSEASSLTGGRLNSWAVTAGNQAKSRYDQAVTDAIPELANTAYSRYQGDMDIQQQLLNTIMNVDNTAYNRFADTRNFDRGVLESDRGFNRGVLESDRNYGRGVLESDRNFNYQKETDTKNFNYQVSRDQVLDGQWMKQFNAEEQQRIVSNALQSRQISISEANAALNREQFDYSKTQDAKEWEYKLAQAAKENKASVDVLGSQYSDMMNSKDPSKWLVENAPYMTKDELKALKALMPDDGSNDLINKLMTQMEK